jgi:hypothetical protein
MWSVGRISADRRRNASACDAAAAVSHCGRDLRATRDDPGPSVIRQLPRSPRWAIGIGCGSLSRARSRQQCGPHALHQDATDIESQPRPLPAARPVELLEHKRIPRICSKVQVEGDVRRSMGMRKNPAPPRSRLGDVPRSTSPSWNCTRTRSSSSEVRSVPVGAR